MLKFTITLILIFILNSNLMADSTASNKLDLLVNAIQDLEADPADGKLLEKVKKFGSDRDPLIRSKTIYAVCNMDAKLPSEIKALAWSLVFRGFQDKDMSVRTAAYQCAGEFQDKAEISLPYLIAGLNEQSGRPQAFSADSIAKLGNRAKPAVPMLVQQLADGPKAKGGTLGQESAADALGKLGDNAKEAVSQLELIIRKYRSDPEFLFSVVKNLYLIDKKNSSAIQMLREFESGKYGNVLAKRAKYYIQNERTSP